MLLIERSGIWRRIGSLEEEGGEETQRVKVIQEEGQRRNRSSEKSGCAIEYVGFYFLVIRVGFLSLQTILMVG